MYDNISNNISTNLFESYTGALNVAPVKLSGYYKIFIDKNLELYLDDYNNRRVKIDKLQPFLPQVANFLKTQSIFIDDNKLRYGAFRNNEQLSYHCPIYLNNINTLPKYFTLTKALNQTITDSQDLHKYGNILNLIDLEKIGLTKIFKDIINSYDYLLNFNWQDSNIIINGYSIIEEIKVEKTIDLLNNQSNQPYLEVLNNKIMNTFKTNNIIFPKFLNIEFEFEYVNNSVPFNNFYGFLSKGTEFEKTNFDNSILSVSLKDYRNKIEYIQEINVANIIEHNFIDVLSVSTIIKPENKLAQIRFKVNNIAVGNIIKINHPDNSTYFEYILTENDIKPTLRETLRSFCIKATNLTGRNLIFTSDVLTNVITIVSNIDDIFMEEYSIEVPTNFILMDDTNNFYSLTESDVIVSSSNTENLYQSVRVGNNFYDVVKTFYFDEQLILRLANFNNDIIADFNTIEIYENKVSKLMQLKPIDFLGFNSNNIALKQYDKTKYIENLLETFDNDNEQFMIAIEKYGSMNNFVDVLPYVTDEIDTVLNVIETKESEIITGSLDNNDTNVLNMLFNTPGATSFITPNILNIDKRFYDNNANQDYRLLNTDKIKFHYFLIKSEAPDYLKDDVRNLRFFTDKPKITSRLISSADNLEYCETIFLGSKYRLPQKYKNYQFAVYLDYQDESAYELKYSFDINNTEKTIYLKINKYLDFIDLIRGGVVGNNALVDLSFFYSVHYPHNTNSEALYTFKSGGLLLCDSEIPVLYQNVLMNDWKYFDPVTEKWYICIKRSFQILTPPLTELFTNDYEQYLYVYSSVNYEGTVHNYVSMVFKITGIRILKDDYLWCEDISVKFFDTDQFFINQYNPSVINKIFQVSQDNIILNVPTDNGTLYDEQTSIATIVVDATNQQFKLINPDYEFSLKESYFEFGRKNIYDEDSNLTVTEHHFYFPEFPFQDWVFQDFVDNFDYESLDNVTYNSIITLFNRNQLWNLIKDILTVDVKFKHATPEQTYNLIHELLLARLSDYSDLYSLEINNTELLDDKFCKVEVIPNDENVAIWKINELNVLTPKVIKINRFHSVYQPYLKLLENELKFQSDITTNRKDSLYNIYDINFYGQNINATGLWKEVQGNILSSLYTKNETFKFLIPYPTTENLTINVINNLKNIIPLEEAIILNKNENYIAQINNNIDEYIKESYIKWLLLNVYKLDSVTNELGQKMEFELIIDNDYSVKLKPKSQYYTRFENAIFNFKRK